MNFDTGNSFSGNKEFKVIPETLREEIKAAKWALDMAYLHFNCASESFVDTTIWEINAAMAKLDALLKELRKEVIV